MFSLLPSLSRRAAAAFLLLATLAATTTAQASTPDALIRDLSNEVITSVKADREIQAGNLQKIIALVDSKVMPNVNFQRMTSSAVGRAWRDATPEQRTRLQAEFKTLLVRVYSGALTQVKDQTVELRPFRAAATDTEVTVRTQVKGRGEPIQLDYRLENTPQGWKIYDVNVLGVWMVEQYRNEFAQVLNNGGIDALITRLAERNKGAGKG
jgi:phospholipid transport system substrate-binding protein